MYTRNFKEIARASRTRMLYLLFPILGINILKELPLKNGYAQSRIGCSTHTTLYNNMW